MAKTTIEIADNLILKAKKKALELGQPLRALVEEALRSYLSNVFMKKNEKKKREKFGGKLLLEIFHLTLIFQVEKICTIG